MRREFDELQKSGRGLELEVRDLGVDSWSDNIRIWDAATRETDVRASIAWP